MPFEDHPEIPGAVAMRRADGSLSPPLSPDMAIGYDPISFAAYKQAKAAPPVDAGAGVPFEAGGETVRMLPASGPSAPIQEPVANAAWDAPKDFAEPIRTQQEINDEAEAATRVANANAKDAAAAGRSVQSVDGLTSGGPAAAPAAPPAPPPPAGRSEYPGGVIPASTGPGLGKAATAGTFAAEPQGGGVAPRQAATGLGSYIEDTERERAWNKAMIEDEFKKKSGGPVRTVPERDQKTGFQIEGARGPDPKLLQAMFEGQQGTPRPELEAAPTLALTPKDVLEVWQPPKVESGKDKNFAPLYRDMTPKEKDQWAAGVAAKAKAEGMSAETLNRLYDPNLSVAKGRQTGEEIDAYRKARITEWDADLAKRSAARDAKNASTIAASRAEEEKMGGPMGLAGHTLRENEQDRDTADLNADRVQQASFLDNQYGDAEQALFNRQRDALADLDTKIKMVSEKASAEVDPKKFWKDKSAGEKALMVIASIFGGGGAALAGQPSMYAARLESAIDADIKAQQTNIANAKGSLNQLQGLYQDVSQRYGSEHAGLLAMKAGRLGGIENQIKANLATATSAKARIQAEKTLALVEQKKRETLVQLSAEMNGKIATNYKTYEARQVGGGGGINKKEIDARLERMRKVSGDLAKDSASIAKDAAANDPRAKEVAIAYNGQDLVFRPNTPTDVLSDTTKTVQAVNGIHRNLSLLDKQQKGAGSSSWDAHTARAMVIPVASQINSALGQGAMSKDEKEAWVDATVDAMVGRSRSEGRSVLHSQMDSIVAGKLSPVIAGTRTPDGGIRPFK